ncbi:uncharacterized protein B0H18DRAFT_1126511 [Fomitopsis serialis]|uniref:uncharacterized protein n=1 Tax=Fomitopsis serialis TaxID=139415 RepID=UPI002008A4C8|nr:uncharacterized protein B0H18DRAFT_1126511 [Neoantrodia serialis]KAH9913193.1 hypothetical protein B0H18DRAFT_1126511 [Neoantrodia serialis]
MDSRNKVTAYKRVVQGLQLEPAAEELAGSPPPLASLSTLKSAIGPGEQQATERDSVHLRQDHDADERDGDERDRDEHVEVAHGQHKCSKKELADHMPDLGNAAECTNDQQEPGKQDSAGEVPGNEELVENKSRMHELTQDVQFSKTSTKQEPARHQPAKRKDDEDDPAEQGPIEDDPCE